MKSLLVLVSIIIIITLTCAHIVLGNEPEVFNYHYQWVQTDIETELSSKYGITEYSFSKGYIEVVGEKGQLEQKYIMTINTNEQIAPEILEVLDINLNLEGYKRVGGSTITDKLGLGAGK